MKKIAIISVALSTILLFGSSVNAQDEEMDTENKEMMAEHQAHRELMKKKMQQRGKHRLIELDTNGDGKVDLKEYVRSAEDRFNKMDLNEDGYITSEEAGEAHKAMREKHRQARKKHMKERQLERSKLEEKNSEKDSE